MVLTLVVRYIQNGIKIVSELTLGFHIVLLGYWSRLHLQTFLILERLCFQLLAALAYLSTFCM